MQLICDRTNVEYSMWLTVICNNKYTRNRIDLFLVMQFACEFGNLAFLRRNISVCTGVVS